MSATTDVIVMYVIYEEPMDIPDAHFVVRRWEGSEGKATAREMVGQAETLHAARRLLPLGCVNLGRFPEDDPVIAEVWMV